MSATHIIASAAGCISENRWLEKSSVKLSGTWVVCSTTIDTGAVEHLVLHLAGVRNLSAFADPDFIAHYLPIPPSLNCGNHHYCVGFFSFAIMYETLQEASRKVSKQQ